MNKNTKIGRFKFAIPIIPNKIYQSTVVFFDLISYIQIIKDRIYETKHILKQEEEKMSSDLIQKVVLDIKSLYIFTKIYFDFFIRYISESFLPKNQKIKSKSFDKHVKSLRGIQFSEDWLIEYRKYLLNFSRIFEFRIKYVRDKFVTHRKLNLRESWGYDVENNRLYIYFEKSSNKFEVEDELKNNIISLGTIYGVDISHNKSQISEFVYLDLILSKLETMDKEMDLNDEELIFSYRDKLGMIFNEEDIFQLIENFSERVTLILNSKFPNISSHYYSRF